LCFIHIVYEYTVLLFNIKSYNIIPIKKIVICTDGTWDKPGTMQGGIPVPSNVEKIYHSLNQSDEQLVKYFPGVGTSGNILKRLFNGITGADLDKKIKEAYKFIVEKYHPGDELYFFGFSRGAYTARSLAGLIRNCGIVKDVKDIEEAFEHYRDRSPDSHPDSETSIELRRRLSHAPGENIFNEAQEGNNNEGMETGKIEWKGDKNEIAKAMRNDHVIRIKFLGIWDTVGSLGLPFPWLRLSNIKRYKFHDITLSSTIDHAYHAIAIDEHRKLFTPCIWEKSIHKENDPLVKYGIAEVKEDKNKYGKNKHVQQMWFTGVHANVGGGYPDSALSSITLHWMTVNAHRRGLAFDYSPIFDYSPYGTLYNSQTWYYALGGNLIRPITLENGDKVKASYWTPNPLYRYSFNEYLYDTVRYRLYNKQLDYNPSNVFCALNTIRTKESSKKIFVDFYGNSHWNRLDYYQ
jgi:uncharacterized protein (DUF2235 family)